MRVLLLGKIGQVGWELQRTLAPLGEVIALDYPEVDFLQPETLRSVVRRTRPEVIVNAAAYTAVDRAEEEPEKAHAINAEAPRVLAEEAHALDAALIHYSTDFVFDGTKGAPYTEADTPNPINEYGRSKLAGEQAIQQVGSAYLIFRTSWVYSLRRPCFVTKVLGWARQHDTLRIVDDQIGSPTWCRMLAEVTAQVLAQGALNVRDFVSERQGVYHLAGTGAVSRFEWAQAILALTKDDQRRVRQVLPARSTDFPTPASRPAFSALDVSAFHHTFGIGLPDWRDALQLAVNHG